MLTKELGLGEPKEWIRTEQGESNDVWIVDFENENKNIVKQRFNHDLVGDVLYLLYTLIQLSIFIYPSIHPSIHPHTYLTSYLSTYLSTYLCTLKTNLKIYTILPTFLPSFLPTYPTTYLPTNLSIYLSFFLTYFKFILNGWSIV